MKKKTKLIILFMSAVLTSFVFLGCVSLGQVTTTSVTRISGTSWQEPIYEEYRYYIDDNFKIVETYEYLKLDATGHNLIQKGVRQTGTRNVTGIEVFLSSGDSFRVAGTAANYYNIHNGSILEYRPNRKKFDAKYIQSIDGVAVQ